MKALTTNIIILASVAVAIAMYSFNTKSPVYDIDRIEHELAGLQNIQLPSSVGFKTDENRDDIFIWARLALVPVHLVYKESGLPDTILVIQSLTNTDTVINGKIIWSGKDEKYSDNKYRYCLYLKQDNAE